MEYYSAIKKNKIAVCRKMDRFGGLNETSQSQKAKYCIFNPMRNLGLRIIKMMMMMMEHEYRRGTGWGRISRSRRRKGKGTEG
jgi:hypothetical protein